MNKQYFGTDGIRGKVGVEPILPEFMLRLGWAVGQLFTEYSQENTNLILVGKDTRISGYMFESALEAGLVSAGLDVLLLGPMPTPAVAYFTRTFNAKAGIMISASHNPYFDNGIKIFSSSGQKLNDQVELAIEAQLILAHQSMAIVKSQKIGKVSRIDDAAGRYIEFCKSCFPSWKNLRGKKIVIDCAHGATYHIAPNVFRELGAEVTALGVTPNGFNINAGVGSTQPGSLQGKVITEQADFGIAFDGDGDRIVMVDHLGELVDGDELLCIIAHYWHTKQQIQGGVVGTVMSNLGLEHALAEINIPFTRAPVGDRHILAELQNRGWQLGGESSGHILCLDKIPTGDGIIAALQVIAALLAADVSLNQLKRCMVKYPQQMINVACERRQKVVMDQSICCAVKNTEKKLAGRGRVLLRASGTEPVVRVMVEGEDIELISRLAEDLAVVVRQVAS